MFSTISSLDYIALCWFAICWHGFSKAADHTEPNQLVLQSLTQRYRYEWMLRMLERGDNRIVDSNLINALMRSVAFFASTSIFIIAGIIAIFGALDTAAAIASDLPFAVPTDKKVFELKLILLLTIFVYSFFKLTWSMRQFNFCAMMIGAAPSHFDDQEEMDSYCRKAGLVNVRAGIHFNQGLRAYEFGLAALTWFINAGLFITATTIVLLVLFRREFASKTHEVLQYHSTVHPPKP